MNNMEGRFSEHRQAWEAIAWVVNGTADESQRELVRTHLGTCADCAAEYALQERLHAAMGATAAPELDPAAALGRLRRRIDEESVAPRPGARRSGAPVVRALVAVAAIEALSIVALSSLLWVHGGRDAGAIYRTLGSGAQAAHRATIRAVFDPSLSLRETRELLNEFQLQIVAGPSDAGVYSLAPADAAAPAGATAGEPAARAEVTSVVATLRAHAGVRFAEPIGAGAARP
jgi:hypothetical protein